MKRDLFIEYLNSLKRNKARFIWEGISIGCGVFCLVIAFAGFNVFYNGSFGQISKTNLESVKLSTQATTKNYCGFSSGRLWNLEADDVAEIEKKFRNIITDAGPVYYFPQNKHILVANGKRDDVNVTATHPSIFPLLSISMRFGRFIDAIDMKQRRKICVVGHNLAEEWYGEGTNPCGNSILVDGTSYLIVGILQKENKMVTPFGDEDNSVLIPYPTADAVYNLEGRLTHLAFSLIASDGYEQRREDVIRYIRMRHNIDPEDTNAVLMESMQDYTQMLATLFKGIGILFWVVFLGLIFTGLLGVFGITLLSINERMDEIGIRLAVGTDPRHIKIQFAYESLITVLISSFTGLAASEIILAVLRTLYFKGIVSNPLFGLPQLSFGGIMTVLLLLLAGGFFSGFIPAQNMANKQISELLNNSK